MTRTFTAPMPSSTSRARPTAFTFTELIVVVVILGLLLLLAVPNIFGLLRQGTFKGEVQELVSAFQMAANAAAQSNKRYEVIIDLTEQRYTMRQITSPDLSQVLEEEIIVDRYLSDKCWVSYVMFDDGDYTNDAIAKFRAGHAGWQYGGKVVLLDEQDHPYSIVINRLNRVVELKKGDVPLLWPRAPEDVPF